MNATGKDRLKIRDYRTSIFIIIIYLFCFQTPLTNVFPFFRYWDEIFALLSVAAFFSYSIKFKMPINKDIKWLILLICFGLIGTIVNNYQNANIVLLDLYSCCKFWIVYFCGKYILGPHWELSSRVKRIKRHVELIIFILFSLSIIDRALDVFPSSSYRYGIKSITLFYNHPTNLVAICCLLMCLLFTSMENNSKREPLGIMLLFIMAMTFRVKAFSVALSYILLWYFIYVRKKKVDIKSLLLFVPLIILISWDQIQYYFVSIQESSARYALLSTSIAIAKDYFPLGTGFGTFASAYSVAPYSPVYSLYGINTVHGLTSANPSFVSDSFWPMILGQFGVLGFIAYIYLLYRLYKKIQSLRPCKDYYIAALFALVYLLISSTSEAAFVNLNSTPFAFLLGLLVKLHKYADERK